MENFWQFVAVAMPVTGALFAVCYKRPFLGEKVVEFFMPMAQAGVCILFGGSVTAILCKIAVGRLAAGMFAGDWAITDGTIDEAGAAEGGRYIIGRIADSVDPILYANLWSLLAFSVALAALQGGSKLVLVARAEQVARSQTGAEDATKAEGSE